MSTSDTSDTQTLDTQTRSDTTHTSHLSRALRRRLDTDQTPLTLPTPVSIDTAQTLLRHCSDTPDTSDTQTQQGSMMDQIELAHDLVVPDESLSRGELVSSSP